LHIHIIVLFFHDFGLLFLLGDKSRRRHSLFLSRSYLFV
jgi:hypothetical protein